MNDERLKEKVDAVRLSLLGKITNKEACKLLEVSARTFKRYKSLFILKGINGLRFIPKLFGEYYPWQD